MRSFCVDTRRICSLYKRHPDTRIISKEFVSLHGQNYPELKEGALICTACRRFVETHPDGVPLDQVVVAGAGYIEKDVADNNIEMESVDDVVGVETHLIPVLDGQRNQGQQSGMLDTNANVNHHEVLLLAQEFQVEGAGQVWKSCNDPSSSKTRKAMRGPKEDSQEAEDNLGSGSSSDLNLNKSSPGEESVVVFLNEIKEPHTIQLRRFKLIKEFAGLVISKMYGFLRNKLKDTTSFVNREMVYKIIIGLERACFNQKHQTQEVYLSKMKFIFLFFSYKYNFLVLFEEEGILNYFVEEEFIKHLSEFTVKKSADLLPIFGPKLAEFCFTIEEYVNYKSNGELCIVCMEYTGRDSLINHYAKKHRSLEKISEQSFPFYLQDLKEFICPWCKTTTKSFIVFMNHIRDCVGDGLKEYRRMRGQKIIVLFFNLKLFYNDDFPEKVEKIEDQKAENFYKAAGKDLDNLKRMFTSEKGFELVTHENLSDEEMKNAIVEFLQPLEENVPYGIYIIVNSHGIAEGFSSSNSRIIPYNNFISHFNREYLDKVPKVFFFMSCREIKEERQEIYSSHFAEFANDINIILPKKACAIYANLQGQYNLTDRNTGTDYLHEMVEFFDIFPKDKTLSVSTFAKEMEERLRKREGVDYQTSYERIHLPDDYAFSMTRAYKPKISTD